MTINNKWEEDFVEKGADIEHTRWAKWQEYFFNKCEIETLEYDGKKLLFLPEELYNRWLKQIKTPYSELSEQEKESDRKEVRTYLPLIQQLLQDRDKEFLSEIRQGILDCPKTDWGDTNEETPDSWEEGYEQCLEDTLDFINKLLETK